MKRLLFYIVALVVLLGAAYAIIAYGPKAPEGGDSRSIQMETAIASGESAEYRYHVQYPKFGDAALDAAIKAKVDAAVAAFKEYPTNPPEYGLPKNELTGSFSDVYVGEDLVSVKLAFSEYTGGAHPNTAIVAVNVDRQSGKELTLEDALNITGLSLSQVAAKSKTELSAKLSDSFFPEGAEAKTENYSTFLVGKNAVTFIFQSYQVGPYSAGPQEVSFARK